MSDYDRQESRIDTGSASIYVTQTGDGEPALVFLHYWGGSSRTWRPVIEQLAGSARCVAIDHRGWGQSSAPDAGYGIEDLAADALAVIDALGLTDYILVGHSMGGKVAQLLASRRPEGLGGVVLVAPAPAKPVAVPVAVRAQMTEVYLTRDAVIATFDGVLRHAPLSDELREQVVEDGLAGSAGAKREWPASAILEDVSADLAGIDVPVLVVAGGQDRVEPTEVMESRVLAEIPGARLEVIEDSGHLIPLEQPQELSDRIAAFRDASVPIRPRGSSAVTAGQPASPGGGSPSVAPEASSTAP
jgi:pimeloyl-ACP methyl ester carboxylesterase